MKGLVESLKRLFAGGKVTKGKLVQMVETGKITAEEQAYIVGGDKKGA